MSEYTGNGVAGAKCYTKNKNSGDKISISNVFANSVWWGSGNPYYTAAMAIDGKDDYYCSKENITVKYYICGSTSSILGGGLVTI